MQLLKRLAYYIVYKDLINKGGLFIGKYDATHGDETFIHGIVLVMEQIAYTVSEKTGDTYSDMWLDNIIESEEKAENATCNSR